MADEVGVAELKRRFSEFLSRVELNGESVVIERRGKQVALIVPLGSVETPPSFSRPKRGLLTAVGAWSEYEDIDGLLRDVRRLREDAVDRQVDPLP